MDVLGVAGKQHEVEMTAGSAGSTTVVVDGTVFEIRRDAADTKKIFVGKPHTVEIKESGDGEAMVVVDGVTHRIDLPGWLRPSVAAVDPQGLGAGTYGMLIGGSEHQVELSSGGENGATVLVDGVAFHVERANARTVLVNGKPHVVEVKERSGSSAGVLIDGSPQTVQMRVMR